MSWSGGAHSVLFVVGSFLQESSCLHKGSRSHESKFCVARSVVYLYNTKEGITSFIFISAFLCAKRDASFWMLQFSLMALQYLGGKYSSSKPLHIFDLIKSLHKGHSCIQVASSP